MTLVPLLAPLQPGAPERSQDVQANFDAIAGVVNGGLSGANFKAASIPNAKLVSDPISGIYKPLLDVTARIAGTGITVPRQLVTNGALSALGAATPGNALHSWNPAADLVIPGATRTLRLRLSASTNLVAPATNVRLELFTITTITGTTTLIVSVAASPVATATLTTPAAGQVTHEAVSSAFAPGSGRHVLVLSTSGAMANGSSVLCRCLLEARQTA